MSGGLRDAVKNGPRAKNAESARIQAKIELEEAEARLAKNLASEHRRKGQGEGIRAWYHRGAAGRWDAEAAKLTNRAHDLRVSLAKAKAKEASGQAGRAKRVVASTADQFGGGPAKAGQPPSQVAKPAGQAKPSQPAGKPGQPLPPKCPKCGMPIVIPGTHKPCPYEPKTTNPGPTKGHPMTSTVSGEAVNIEQTRANLDQLKGQVADLRGSFEGISGSLASGGLDKLAGTLAQADDSLDSVMTQIGEAETHLADQEAIAEAAQAAGEMHSDTSFYAA